MESYRTSSGVLVHPRPVTSRYGGPGDTPAKRRAARQERRLRAYRVAQTVPYIPKGSRVLDVGCGDGELFRWLGSRLGLGMGIDPLLPGSIVGARYRLIKGWFPEDLPEVGSFDVVTLLAVLEEIPVEGRSWLVAACTRRLAPGGRLVTVGNLETGSVDLNPGLVIVKELEILGAYATTQAELHESFRLVESGALRSWVADVMPLADAHRAHDRLEKREVAGRLVLEPVH